MKKILLLLFVLLFTAFVSLFSQNYSDVFYIENDSTEFRSSVSKGKLVVDRSTGDKFVLKEFSTEASTLKTIQKWSGDSVLFALNSLYFNNKGLGHFIDTTSTDQTKNGSFTVKKNITVYDTLFFGDGSFQLVAPKKDTIYFEFPDSSNITKWRGIGDSVSDLITRTNVLNRINALSVYDSSKNTTANVTFSNIIDKRSILKHIVIQNTTPNIVNISIGITPAGSELGTYSISAGWYPTIILNEYAKTTTTKTIYITASTWNAANLNIWLKLNKAF